jgi:meso-butanediol dehydrogenase/(S,S)-butanediol dehydrogenase/diacetyl reductase
MSAYCGSKFAAIGITQSLAAELAPFNIRVNALCPGIVGTAMWLEHLLPSNTHDQAEKNRNFEQQVNGIIPLGRPQTVADMGQAALYLATAPNVTGIALNVAGGMTMS